MAPFDVSGKSCPSAGEGAAAAVRKSTSGLCSVMADMTSQTDTNQAFRTSNFPDLFAAGEYRVRLRTLITLRWLAVAGQTATVLTVSQWLHFELPLAACLAVISASAWFNIFLSVAQPGQRILSETEAALHLSADVLQLALLIAMTGGPNNPFILLLGAPVVIAFSSLRAPAAGVVAVVGALAALGSGLWHGPLPWRADAPFDPPVLFEVGLWTALVSGAGFMSVFAWRVSAEARRMSEALAATQSVLAREQRLSALGGLAAAAAHELGTPLGTIQVTAKEMLRATEPGSELREDAALLVSQAERCRDLLRQLARRGEEGDEVHARLALRDLLDEVVEPLRGLGPDIAIDIGDGPPPPMLQRAPEMLYAIGNFVENAVDYAAHEVRVVGRVDGDWLEVEIGDDGPGFAPEMLLKLGEPYVSSRSEGQERGGLGLGFFIAKTFVERVGGNISFGNRRAPATGAVVRARWPISVVRAPTN